MAKDDKKPKVDPVRAVLEEIRKRAGKGSVALLSDGADSDIEEVLPSGIDVLDHHVLGIGGWPVGRIVELYAGEGDGKTSLLLQTMAGVQHEEGVGFLAETEHALDSQRATVFGCNLDRIILSQPDTFEEALQMMEAALESFPKSKKGDPPFFVGWDSLAATPTKREVTEGLDFKATIGDRAKLVSTGMRVITRLAIEKRALVFIVNQTRSKIGVMFGPDKTTPGGSALKFHASVRLELFSGKSVKVRDEHVGKTVTMMVPKTKIGGKPWAKAKVRLYYDSGWNNVWSTINLAKDRKLISNDAEATEENYVAALKALGWPRGFAKGSLEAPGVDLDADAELTGEAGNDLDT